jgi:hypothetical protein
MRNTFLVQAMLCSALASLVQALAFQRLSASDVILHRGAVRRRKCKKAWESAAGDKYLRVLKASLGRGRGKGIRVTKWRAKEGL